MNLQFASGAVCLVLLACNRQSDSKDAAAGDTPAVENKRESNSPEDGQETTHPDKSSKPSRECGVLVTIDSVSIRRDRVSEGLAGYLYRWEVKGTVTRRAPQNSGALKSGDQVSLRITSLAREFPWDNEKSLPGRKLWMQIPDSSAKGWENCFRLRVQPEYPAD